MSWTDAYPILTEEMVSQYESEADQETKAALGSYWRVADLANESESEAMVALSIYSSKAGQPLPDDEADLVASLNLKSFFDFLPGIMKESGGFSCRVYLSAELSCLLPRLARLGCEVALMAAPCPHPAVGNLWPLLALQGPKRPIAFLKPQSIVKWPTDFQRSLLIGELGLAAWRMPHIPAHLNDSYFPIARHRLGANLQLETATLAAALMWHRDKKSIDPKVSLKGCCEFPLGDEGSPFTDLDLIFGSVALYPRLADQGLLTYSPYVPLAPLFSLDIEYATWANSKSELIFYREPSCCAESEGTVTG